MAREAEDELLQKYVGETRFDQGTCERFLVRIRQRLEAENPPPTTPLGRTPAMEAQFEAEQAAGRAAVKRAQENR